MSRNLSLFLQKINFFQKNSFIQVSIKSFFLVRESVISRKNKKRFYTMIWKVRKVDSISSHAGLIFLFFINLFILHLINNHPRINEIFILRFVSIRPEYMIFFFGQNRRNFVRLWFFSILCLGWKLSQVSPHSNTWTGWQQPTTLKCSGFFGWFHLI